MKIRWRNVLFILGMFVVVIFLMDLSQRLEEMDKLNTELESVQAEATAVMGTQVGLLTQVAYATSDAAVEQWAYEDGKWVRQGETLVELVPVGEPVPTAQTSSIEMTSEQPKWRIWWELFFGDQP